MGCSFLVKLSVVGHRNGKPKLKTQQRLFSSALVFWKTNKNAEKAIENAKKLGVWNEENLQAAKSEMYILLELLEIK